jgi:hypothetical protein
MRCRKPLSACCLVALSCFAPAFALSGVVTDEFGAPIERARACYFVDYLEDLCSLTDADGLFELPDSQLDTIRIVAEGYVPRKLPAVEPDGPITLERAAAILVRLVEAATGEGIADGKVEIVQASGRLRSFPANRAGVRVRTYEPGLVTVTGRAEGYLAGKPQQVELKAGKESEVEIRLRREETAAPAEDDPVSDPG